MSRKYTLEFKQEAIKLVTEQGYSRQKTAIVLGTSCKNVDRWVCEFKASGELAKVKPALTADQEEINRLRKENERLKMEREILKKAAAFFANEKF